MSSTRVVIDLDPSDRLAFERDLARLAQKYGTNLERSPDPCMPALYLMHRRYVPNQSQPQPAA